MTYFEIITLGLASFPTENLKHPCSMKEYSSVQYNNTTQLYNKTTQGTFWWSTLRSRRVYYQAHKAQNQNNYIYLIMLMIWNNDMKTRSSNNTSHTIVRIVGPTMAQLSHDSTCLEGLNRLNQNIIEIMVRCRAQIPLILFYWNSFQNITNSV